MKLWTLGFVVSYGMDAVLLQKKTHPEYLAGRWNGIGGSVENGEGYLQCMRRECLEETGLDIPDWTSFCSHTDDHGHMECFMAICNVEKMARAVQQEWAERIQVFPIFDLPSPGITENCLMPNVSWLIPMALSVEINGITYTVREDADDSRKKLLDIVRIAGNPKEGGDDEETDDSGIIVGQPAPGK